MQLRYSWLSALVMCDATSFRMVASWAAACEESGQNELPEWAPRHLLTCELSLNPDAQNDATQSPKILEAKLAHADISMVQGYIHAALGTRGHDAHEAPASSGTSMGGRRRGVSNGELWTGSSQRLCHSQGCSTLRAACDHVGACPQGLSHALI